MKIPISQLEIWDQSAEETSRLELWICYLVCLDAIGGIRFPLETEHVKTSKEQRDPFGT